MSERCSLAVIANEKKYRDLLCHIVEQDQKVDLVAINRGKQIDEAKLRSIKPEVILCSFECLGTTPQIRESIALNLNKMAEVVWICENNSMSFFDCLAKEHPCGNLLVIVKPEKFSVSEEGKKTLSWEVSVALRKAILNTYEKRQPSQRISFAKEPHLKESPLRTTVSHRRSARSLATFIGISTGGPEALGQMLPSLPSGLAGPIFIVQHMPENFIDTLAKTLDPRCEVTVVEAKNGMEAKPGMVYLAPGGDKHMKVVKDAKGTILIRLVHGDRVNNCKPSADVLFESAIEVYGSEALGIVMTGMGADGAKGLADMKQCGCPTAIQDEDSCVVFGMPGEAKKRGAAQVVLSLDQIAGYIIRRMGEVNEYNTCTP